MRRKIFSNWSLALMSTGFLLLFIFVLDRDNYLAEVKLDAQIKALEVERDSLNVAIDAQRAIIDGLRDSAFVEKFARETYNMKRVNEVLYIVK